jgi:hypothetical protein
MGEELAPDDETRLLDPIQRAAFRYFSHETSPINGLVVDSTEQNAPASIAAIGLGLTAYPVAVERGFIPRRVAAKRALTTLRFFRDCKQGPEPDATGYHGLYYHFLDMRSGARAWQSELSTIDSAFLFAGMLAVAAYFDEALPDELEIRELADRLCARADWRWALNEGATITHGWTPEHGFLPYRWQGYDEALLLYVLALGSPSFPIPAESYRAWTATYQWKNVHGSELLYAGPLFVHQLSHTWIDFRGIQDSFMREHGSDYFENTRRATVMQQQYAVRNPAGFAMYGDQCWGTTASEGPGECTRETGGVTRRFFGYCARGVPHGPDDGTLAPWAVVASLPFAPTIVLPSIARIWRLRLGGEHPYGFKTTFNPTFPDPGGSPLGWISPRHCGLNQGPIVIMIENYLSGLVWRLMRGCRHIVDGLRAAGFEGGWLTPEGRAP